MDVWRGRYNRTTGRARRARIGRVIDAATIAAVDYVRSHYGQYSAEDLDCA